MPSLPSFLFPHSSLSDHHPPVSKTPTSTLRDPSAGPLPTPSSCLRPRTPRPLGPSTPRDPYLKGRFPARPPTPDRYRPLSPGLRLSGEGGRAVIAGPSALLGCRVSRGRRRGEPQGWGRVGSERESEAWEAPDGRRPRRACSHSAGGRPSPAAGPPVYTPPPDAPAHISVGVRPTL